MLAMATNQIRDRFIGSSGEGGAKFCGEIRRAVENVASTSEYHWMAGILEIRRAINAKRFACRCARLVALCAPGRSLSVLALYKSKAAGSTPKALSRGVGAGPVYKLLGKKISEPPNFRDGNRTDCRDVAFRQHAVATQLVPTAHLPHICKSIFCCGGS